VSSTLDNMLADPKQIITNFDASPGECRADVDKAQRKAAERTIWRGEAFAQQTATAEVAPA
jgi:hypothetical protein